MATESAALVLRDGGDTLIRNDLLRALGAFKLTAREYRIAMAIVASEKGATVKAIAARTGMEIHHVRDAARVLEAAQVVKRTRTTLTLTDPATWIPGETKRRRRGVPHGLRFQILERDGFRCVYCGATAADERLEVDHRVPVAAGGLSTPDNLATACQPCNRGKGASHG